MSGRMWTLFDTDNGDDNSGDDDVDDDDNNNNDSKKSNYRSDVFFCEEEI